MDYEEIKQALKENVIECIDLSRDMEDSEIRDIIDNCIINFSGRYGLSLNTKTRLAKEMFNSMRGLDILEELINDKSVTEIMINGCDNIFLEKKGKLIKWERRFESRDKLEDVIQQIVSECNRVVNEASPIVDARLRDGSRVNVVLPPISLCGPIVTIRKFPEHPIRMDDLVRFGAISEEVTVFLKKLVLAGYNIIISGGTGSGKTTFLNALSNYIPKDQRIITIEDSAELQITGVANLVRLETRNANVEGCTEITIRDLIKASLRMRPDRIVVGEVRGAEAIDMIQAMNTGHDGSLSTGHANSAVDMLSRLETMVLMAMNLPLSAIRGQLASGIDIIVHLGRLRDKSRKVLEIVEILDYDGDRINTSTLYEFIEEKEENGKIIGQIKKRNELKSTKKLENAGIRLSS